MEKKWWQKEIVYQIYPKSFCDSNNDGIGDINGITSKLDYLKNLGVTMLWICPIFKSPMDDNGYDISDYFDLAPEFGTMKDLKNLIEKAKEKGIKIILDLVINHSSDEHEWFKKALENPKSKYHNYYIFKEGEKKPNNLRSIFGGSVWEKVEGRDEYYFHTFGKKQPDLNWENPQLREVLYNIVNQWLEFGIAGFRIDAITFIKKDLSFKSIEADGVDGLAKCTKTCRNQKGIKVFLDELKEKCFKKYDCMTVAEAPGVDYEELDDFIGKDGFFSMIFDFKAADLDINSGSEWFKRKSWSIKDLNDKIMNYQMAVQKFGWAANFIENHDQPRATTKYLLENEENIDAVKMMGSMYFFLRGTPYIYQGQELGMINFKREGIKEFNDISSIDQYYRAIKEGCTKKEALYYINLRSRDNARTPFPWTNEENGGFSKTTPWLKSTETFKKINALNQLEDKNSIFNFYKSMIDFRKNSQYKDCLIYGDIEKVKTTEKTIGYLRKLENKEILCLFNFDNKKVIENIEELKIENIKNIFSNITGEKIENTKIELQPFQGVLFEIKRGR